MNHSKSSSFDSVAETYNVDFTFSEIGKLQRKRVYHWLNRIDFFKEPKHVFEVNCGTAYDAKLFAEQGHKVIATDGSEKMVEVAKKTESQIEYLSKEF